jgi:cation transport protein ChaC
MPGASPDIWIFGYGSLMWNPGFPFAESRHARLDGYHRAFCIYSVHYRGSPRRPGLVLGLDRGGSCEGMAFRLEPATAAATLDYVRRRELVYSVYRESLLPVTLVGSAKSGAPAEVQTLAYIAEHAHPAYAGRVTLARQVELIRGACGKAGTNLDYVVNTLAHLGGLGIAEPRLARILTIASPFISRGLVSEDHRPRSVALTRSWAQKPIVRPHTVRDKRFGHRAKLTGALQTNETD